MPIAYLLLLLTLLGGIVGYVEYDKHKAVEAALKNAQIEGLKKEVEDQKGAAKHAKELADQRAAEAKREAERAAAFEKRLKQVADTSPAAKRWLDTPVDPDVRRLRRDSDSSLGLVLRPGSRVAGDGRTSDAGRNEPRPVDGSPQAPSSTPSVQPREAGRTEDHQAAESESTIRRLRALRGKP